MPPSSSPYLSFSSFSIFLIKIEGANSTHAQPPKQPRIDNTKSNNAYFCVSFITTDAPESRIHIFEITFNRLHKVSSAR